MGGERLIPVCGGSFIHGAVGYVGKPFQKRFRSSRLAHATNTMYPKLAMANKSGRLSFLLNQVNDIYQHQASTSIYICSQC